MGASRAMRLIWAMGARNYQPENEDFEFFLCVGGQEFGEVNEDNRFSILNKLEDLVV